MSEFFGCDGIREWALSQGFRVTFDSLAPGNGCNWYAYRRSDLPARECDCNDGERMQLVIKPHEFSRGDQVWRSAEIDVTGEVESVWFKLTAYSLPEEKLRERLPEIERRLIAAWNALAPIEAA